MIASANPKLNRVKYAAMLAGAMAVVAFPSVGLAAVATAQAGTWDIDAYDDCMHKAQNTVDWVKPSLMQEQICCAKSGGLWDVDLNKCVAPASSGSSQGPGSLPPRDLLGDAPAVTRTPPRPIQVPSDIATAQAVTQGDESPS